MGTEVPRHTRTEAPRHGDRGATSHGDRGATSHEDRGATSRGQYSRALTAGQSVQDFLHHKVAACCSLMTKLTSPLQAQHH